MNPKTLLRVCVALHLAVQRGCDTISSRGERGQATAEYALVVLGAAALAMLLVACATPCSEHGCHVGYARVRPDP